MVRLEKADIIGMRVIYIFSVSDGMQLNWSRCPADISQNSFFSRAERHSSNGEIHELLIEPIDQNTNYQIDVYGVGYAVAVEKGFDVRTCAICRFHRPGEWPFAFFCCPMHY